MDIRIVDRARNVTVVPTKGPPFVKPAGSATKDQPITHAGVLDQLLVGQAVHTGQIEFECDAEFMTALNREKPEALVEEDEIDTLHGKRSRTYKGVPIVVWPKPEPPKEAA